MFFMNNTFPAAKRISMGKQASADTIASIHTSFINCTLWARPRQPSDGAAQTHIKTFSRPFFQKELIRRKLNVKLNTEMAIRGEERRKKSTGYPSHHRPHVVSPHAGYQLAPHWYLPRPAPLSSDSLGGPPALPCLAGRPVPGHSEVYTWATVQSVGGKTDRPRVVPTRPRHRERRVCRGTHTKARHGRRHLLVVAEKVTAREIVATKRMAFQYKVLVLPPPLLLVMLMEVQVEVVTAGTLQLLMRARARTVMAALEINQPLTVARVC
jgi:hypothetical protein